MEERLRLAAELARVAVAEEAETLDFDRVLAFAGALTGAPLEGAAPPPANAYRAVPELGLSGLRADAPLPSLPPGTAERLAPEARDGYVAVPRTVE